MKANRFTLTAFLALALLAAGVGLGAAAQWFQENTAHASAAPAVDSLGEIGQVAGLDLDLLLNNVVDRWQLQESLTADVRWKVHLFGATISGAGEYTQSGRGAAQRHGLYLSADDPQFPMTLRQAVLSREPVLWTQWRSTLEESATMVRLADIKAAAQRRTESSGREMPTAGIAHLIWRLRQAYDFQTARHIVVGQRQLLLVQGVAKNNSAKEMVVLPFLDRKADGTSLLLDAATGFPYRIQWEAVESKDMGSARRCPLVTVDLFHVRLESSANPELLQPNTVVPNATDETEGYRMGVLGDAQPDTMIR